MSDHVTGPQEPHKSTQPTPLFDESRRVVTELVLGAPNDQIRQLAADALVLFADAEREALHPEAAAHVVGEVAHAVVTLVGSAWLYDHCADPEVGGFLDVFAQATNGSPDRALASLDRETARTIRARYVDLVRVPPELSPKPDTNARIEPPR
jgi:hypothetical protein